MAKVLLINPVVREEDVPRHVPYGIALLAAIAEQKGHEVQVYDMNAWRKDESVLRDVLVADEWEVIALGGMTTTYSSCRRIIEVARETIPGVIIVLGGGILTSLPHDIMGLLKNVDIGVIGEAFETWPEILEFVDLGIYEWEKINGTISRNKRGKLILSPIRELIEDLDILPYPAWDMFPLEEVYFKNSEVLLCPGRPAKKATEGK